MTDGLGWDCQRTQEARHALDDDRLSEHEEELLRAHAVTCAACRQVTARLPPRGQIAVRRALERAEQALGSAPSRPAGPFARRRLLTGLLAASVLFGALGLAWLAARREVLVAAPLVARDPRGVVSTVGSGDRVSAGSRLWIEGLRLRSAARVAVFGMADTGELIQLFPARGGVSEILYGGMDHRIPAPGSEWTVTEGRGFATVFVAASAERLGGEAVAALLRRAADRIRAMAASVPARWRGDDALPPEALREEQEREVERLLKERFDSVSRSRFRHGSPA